MRREASCNIVFPPRVRGTQPSSHERVESLALLRGFQSPARLGNLYVDKTRRIASLPRSEYRFVFLAQSRRFGKSLLVLTLEALFKGERARFADIWIHDSDWAWEPHAILRLDMTEVVARL